MLRLPDGLLPVHLQVTVGALPLDPRPVRAAGPLLALLNAARRGVHACCQTAAAERPRQVAADKLRAVAVDALGPDARIKAGHREQLVHVPGRPVRVLPLTRRHVLHAVLVTCTTWQSVRAKNKYCNRNKKQ